MKSKVKGLRIVEINEIEKRYKAYSGNDSDNTMIADMRKLNLSIKRELRGVKGCNIAIVGHMVQELNIKPDICVTIRASPSILFKRQKARGYHVSKIKENIVSEAVDYCGEGASKRCKLHFEVETEEEKRELISYISELMKHGKLAKRLSAPKSVERLKASKDMMAEFLKFIKRNNIGL